MVACYDSLKGGLDSYSPHRVVNAFEYSRLMRGLGKDANSLTIGVGDFNMQPDSLPYKLFMNMGCTLRSAWSDGEEPDTFNHPHNSNVDLQRAPEKIDHIFYKASDNVQVKQKQIVFDQRIIYRDISLSDHFGLWAQFEFDSTVFITQSAPTMSKPDPVLVNDIEHLVSAHISDVMLEKKLLYSFLSFLVVVEIALMLGLFFGGLFSPSWRKERAIFTSVIISSALLVGTWGFGTCFRAFAFANEEIASHRQFLMEFSLATKSSF